MLEVWSWPTPNGQKVHIALEELGLQYKVIPINIGAGDQFKPEFLKITPNHRIPAIVDPDGPGGKPFTLFESAAILIYSVGKERRQADPERPDRALQMPRMDDVPDGRRRPDVRPMEPFRRLRAGENPVRDRALHQRGQAADPGAEPPARGGALARRGRVQHGRHHHLSVDPHRHRAIFSLRGAGLYRPRRISGGASAGTTKSRRGRQCSAVWRCWPTPSVRARSPIPSAKTHSARPNSRCADPDIARRRRPSWPAACRYSNSDRSIASPILL